MTCNDCKYHGTETKNVILPTKKIELRIHTCNFLPGKGIEIDSYKVPCKEFIYVQV